MKDIMPILLALISGGLITEMVRLLFLKVKINREQRAEVNVEIIKKRIEAIQEARKMCNILNVMEILEIAHPGENKPIFTNFSSQPAIYAAVLEDRKAWLGFYDKLCQVTDNFNDWFDCEVGAWLLYLNRYAINLSQYLESIKLWKKTYYLGVIFIADLQMWQREFDAVLVRKMNNIALRSEAHTGAKWEKFKNKMEIKWQNTVLYNVLYKQDSEITKIVNSFISNISVVEDEAAVTSKED